MIFSEYDYAKRKELHDKTILNFEENGYSQYHGDSNSFEKNFLVDGKVFRVTAYCSFMIFGQSYIHADLYTNSKLVFSASYSENCEKDICSDIENNIVYFWLHSFIELFDHNIIYSAINSGNGILVKGIDFRHFGFVEIKNLTELSPKEAFYYISRVISNRKMIEE